MSEPFKLTFERKPSGLMRADFKDDDGEACVLKESNSKQNIWLGYSNGDRMCLHRNQTKALGFALIRFAKTGSLAEPPPEQQMAHFKKCFDEAEEHDRLQTDVSECARAFVAAKAELLQAYNDGHDAAGPYCHDLQGQIADIEKMLDNAVKAINTWLKEHGWEVEGK